MKQLELLMETGVYETLAPSKAMTVHDLLKELNLNRDGLLTVLVNGKKARLDDEITPKDEICMIPMIAGGGQDKLCQVTIWFIDWKDFDRTFSDYNNVIKDSIDVDEGLLKFVSIEDGKRHYNTFILANMLSFHVIDHEVE